MKGDPVQVEPGKWRFRISAGQDPLTGQYRQISKTVDAKNLTEARDARDATRHELKAQKAPGTKESFAYAVDRWLEQRVVKGREITTMRAYRQRANVVKKALGDISMGVLDSDHLERFYSQLIRQNCKPNTIDRYHAVIRGALNLAVTRGWITKNPATDTARPSIKRPDLNIPTPPQVRAILEAAGDLYPEASMFLQLAVDTWARRGELSALRWSSIDMDKATVLISEAVVGHDDGTVAHKDTKTHARRTLTIRQDVLERLQKYRQWQTQRARDAGLSLVEDPYLFSDDADGAESWHPDKASRAFRAACRKAGVRGVRLHDIRHFGATYSLAAGMPIGLVSYRLGHARISTTYDIYVKELPERDESLAEFMGELMGD